MVILEAAVMEVAIVMEIGGGDNLLKEMLELVVEVVVELNIYI